MYDASRVIELIKALGWRIRFVPHEVIEDYNACYRVVYRGMVISPPAADELNIPLNEIWVSERLRDYLDYVLFHELREIEYRRQGYSIDEAHIRARVDEAIMFCGDPLWLQYFKEFPDSTVPRACLQTLCNALDRGIRDQERLYTILVRCIQTN